MARCSQPSDAWFLGVPAMQTGMLAERMAPKLPTHVSELLLLLLLLLHHATGACPTSLPSQLLGNARK